MVWCVARRGRPLAGLHAHAGRQAHTRRRHALRLCRAQAVRRRALLLRDALRRRAAVLRRRPRRSVWRGCRRRLCRLLIRQLLLSKGHIQAQVLLSEAHILICGWDHARRCMGGRERGQGGG